MRTRGSAGGADLQRVRAANLAATPASPDVRGQPGHVWPNRRNVLDVLFATLNVRDRPATFGALVEPLLDVLIDLRRGRTKCRRMSLGSPGRLVLIRRLLGLVAATKWCRLTSRGALEFFDLLLKRGDELLQGFEFVETLMKRSILGFKLLNAKVAWIGVHAILLASRMPNVTLQVCAVDNHRASKLPL
jgi:hypothetical protein